MGQKGDRTMVRVPRLLGRITVVLLVFQLVGATELNIVIVDADTGAPLPTARVTIKEGDRALVANHPVGEGGAWRFDKLQPGTYSLIASFPGYRKRSRTVTLTSEGTETVTIGLRQYQAVSMVALLADPERFDGAPVRVVGYLATGPERRAIYLHREDWKNNLSRNAVWLRPDERPLSEYERKYVSVAADFVATDHGHLGLYGGALANIESIVVWRTD
jgi:hypothetical protein